MADQDGFMDRLEFGETAPAPPVHAAGAEPVMVVRSVRWSLELDARLKSAAKQRAMTVSQLLRDLVEVELAALENDRPISRADALRALAGLRPLDGAA